MNTTWIRNHPNSKPDQNVVDGVLNVIGNHSLHQHQTTPTFKDSILELFFTTLPNIVKSIDTIPGISDHLAVIAQVDVQAKATPTTRRQVPRYKDANFEAIKSDLRDLQHTHFT